MASPLQPELIKFQHYPTLEPGFEVFIAMYFRDCLQEPPETSVTQPHKSSNTTQNRTQATTSAHQTVGFKVLANEERNG